MKKLILILFVLFSCESDNYIFPQHGEYGENILHENKTEFIGSYRSDRTWYSLKTEIPVKIIIKQISGLWYIGVMDSVWQYTKFNGTQEFVSNKSADKMVYFKDSGTAIIKYYKNNKVFLEKQIYWEY